MTKTDYKPLGQYITMVDERNRTLESLPLLGVSVDKKLIPSVANTIGSDMSSYKILKQKQFVYIADTSRRGDKIAITLNNTNDSALVSQAYTVFEVNESELLPEYLMLWVSRPEFDRYARFMSHGSVRELFSWEDMCNVTLPVPSITEQRRIVNEYQTVERRIKNNETLIQKLEETAQAIYHHTFVEGIDENNLPEGWRIGCLGEVAEINPSRKTSKQLMPCVEMSNLSMTSTYPDSWDYKEYNGGMKFKNGDTIMARITPCLENGKAAYINFLQDNEVGFGSTEYIVLSSKGEFPPEFFYFLVRNNEFINFAISNMNGTSGRQRVNGNDLAKYIIPIPNDSVLDDISNKFNTIIRVITLCSRELHHLRALQSLLTSKLA